MDVEGMDIPPPPFAKAVRLRSASRTARMRRRARRMSDLRAYTRGERLCCYRQAESGNCARRRDAATPFPPPSQGGLPAVTQLAEPDEHRARIRCFADIGKRLAQPCDHRRVLQPQEGVDAFLLPECRYHRRRRIVMARLAE